MALILAKIDNSVEKHARIFVAGHLGLVGSSIFSSLQNQGFTQLITANRKEADLTDAVAVEQFFAKQKPEYVFLAAAKVGGIGANKTYPADFIHQNLLIECNVIHAAYRHGVTKLLFLGSSCMYPTECPQPMHPSHLYTGPLDPNTQPYAVAKLAGMELCRSYARQYRCNFITAIPANLYGVNDNWDLNNSHVLPALLRKVHTAKLEGKREVVLWGDGSPYREFVLNEDLADACIYLMQHYSDTQTPINVGSGEEAQIKTLAETIKRVVGWDGEFVWDTTKPNGTPRKLMDNTALESLGYRNKHTLATGIQKVYAEVFLSGKTGFKGL